MIIFWKNNKIYDEDVCYFFNDMIIRQEENLILDVYREKTLQISKREYSKINGLLDQLSYKKIILYLYRSYINSDICSLNFSCLINQQSENYINDNIVLLLNKKEDCEANKNRRILLKNIALKLKKMKEYLIINMVKRENNIWEVKEEIDKNIKKLQEFNKEKL